MPISRFFEPHPGRHAGSEPNSATRSTFTNDDHSAVLQPNVRPTSSPFSIRTRVGTVSMSSAKLRRSEVSSVMVPTAATSSGNAMSSWLCTVCTTDESTSDARTGATREQVAQSRFTNAWIPSRSSLIVVARSSARVGTEHSSGSGAARYPAGGCRRPSGLLGGHRTKLVAAFDMTPECFRPASSPCRRHASTVLLVTRTSSMSTGLITLP